jgi:hypothetical protein
MNEKNTKQITIIHMSYTQTRHYIVAMRDANSYKLLYKAPLVTTGPATIAANHGKLFNLEIGSVQGLYYIPDNVFDIQPGWYLSNARAFNCNSLQWYNGGRTFIELVQTYLDLSALSTEHGHTIIISATDNNIFTTENKVLLLGDPANISSFSSAEINKRLSNNQISAFLDDPAQPFYGVLEATLSGDYIIHPSDLGALIIRVNYINDMGNIPPALRKMRALIRTVIGISHEQAILERLAPQHKPIIDRIINFIDAKAEEIYNMSVHDISVARNKKDEIIQLFTDKYIKDIKQGIITHDLRTIKDYLMDQTFLDVFARQLASTISSS